MTHASRSDHEGPHADAPNAVPARAVGAFDAGVDHELLNEHLPLGVLVVQSDGTIRHVNRRAATLAGYQREDLVGHSLVEFVEPADIDFLIASLSFASNYDEEVMGPTRIRFLHHDGRARWTEYWAYECPASFGFEGYIVTMSPESVTDNLANAAFQIASDEPLSTSLTSLARAANSYPLVATGSMIVQSDRLSEAPAGEQVPGTDYTLIGAWPEPLLRYVDDPALPWHDVFASGDRRDVDIAQLPEPVRTDALAAGFRSVWMRPVVTRQSAVVAAFVAWRYEPGIASPNQERHLDEVVGLARLAFDNDEHRRQLELMATTDPLTGLPNRAGLARRLRDVEGQHISVLYVDLDGFKQVNDTYGHGVGDLVIVAAGQRLVSLLRETDAVFRVGGDEFVVVCRDISDDVSADAAGQIASRIVNRLGAPFRVDEALVTVGASVGVALRSPEENATELLRRADLALLSAKRDGKSRWTSAPVAVQQIRRS